MFIPPRTIGSSGCEPLVREMVIGYWLLVIDWGSRVKFQVQVLPCKYHEALAKEVNVATIFGFSLSYVSHF